MISDFDRYEDWTESVVSYEEQEEIARVCEQSLSQAAEVEFGNEIEYCVLDFETSGFSPRVGARVIELGAAIVRDKTIIDEFTTLCCPQPGFTFPKKITEVTSIKPNMLHVEGIPTCQEAMRKLSNFIGDRIIIAHNASFDWRFLVAEFERYEISIPSGLPVCTLILSKRLLPKQSTYRLASLAELIDFTPPSNCSYHRAMTDVYATTELWFHLQDLAQESREDLVKAGEIKPPKQKKNATNDHKDNIKTKGKESRFKNTPIIVATASATTAVRMSLEEEKAKAKIYRDLHFPPKIGTTTTSTIVKPPRPPKVESKPSKELTAPVVEYFFYDSTPIIPVFPPGNILAAKNVIVKDTQPWRDSYELFQSNKKSFQEVVNEHPRNLARSTVFNHMLDAFRQGNAVDLLRLVECTKEVYPVPSSEECQIFKNSLAHMNIDPTVDGSWFLAPVLQQAYPAACSTDDKSFKQMMYSKLKWYQLIMFHGISLTSDST